MNLQELQQSFQTKQAELSALLAKGDDITPEELQTAADATSELEALRGKIETAKQAAHSLTALREKQQALGDWAASGTVAQAPAAAAAVASAIVGSEKQFKIPATVARKKSKNFSSPETAYAFAQFLYATAGNGTARRYCREHGISLMPVTSSGVQLAQSEIVNTAGGFLVIPEFEQELIDLREKFGVARRVLRNRTMTSDTLTITRRVSGLTAYNVTDGDSITESTKGWDQVTLTAKKIACLNKISSELNEDAFIDLADDIAYEIAYAFASLEDDCAFNGDGTSTYLGIQGLRAKLQDVDGAGTDSAGLVTGTGSTWAALTLADFNSVKGKLPLYADDDRVVWVCHRTFYADVMERLMLAAGGVTDAMIAAGAQPRFLGYPVVFAQKMPSATATTTVSALLGNFGLGAAFGDRRQTTIMVSEHVYFANDQIGIRGTERFDINIHDVGSSSAPGPIVGIQTGS